MARRKAVMVVHPINNQEQMPTLRGVSDYAHARGNCVLHFNPEMDRLGLNELKGWPGRGAPRGNRSHTVAAR